jgi:hypothetical protein
MEALVLESGTSMEYFTGISCGPVNGRWWQSFANKILYVCPGFEEGRFKELIS